MRAGLSAPKVARQEKTMLTIQEVMAGARLRIMSAWLMPEQCSPVDLESMELEAREKPAHAPARAAAGSGECFMSEEQMVCDGWD